MDVTQELNLLLVKDISCIIVLVKNPMVMAVFNR